jgi:competence transcription factor ComK
MKGVFKWIELDLKKIKSIKLFKNRKVEVEFKDNNTVNEFVKEFIEG